MSGDRKPIRWPGPLLCLMALVAFPSPNARAEQAGRPAQDVGRGVRAPAAGARADMPVAELERLFDGLELVEARRALGLDDDQYLRFAQRLERLQTIRVRHRARRMGLLRELRTAASATAPGERTTQALLEAFDQLQVEQASERMRAQVAIDQVLTVAQRVQFRLFQERFERRKLNLLARARAAGTSP